MPCEDLSADTYSVDIVEAIEELVLAGEVLATRAQGFVMCVDGQHKFELPCPHCGAAL